MSKSLPTLTKMLSESKARQARDMRRFYKFAHGVAKNGGSGINSIDLSTLVCAHVMEREWAFRYREFGIDMVLLHEDSVYQRDLSFLFGSEGGVIVGPNQLRSRLERSIRHYETIESVDTELAAMQEQFGSMPWEVTVDPKLME